MSQDTLDVVPVHGLQGKRFQNVGMQEWYILWISRLSTHRDPKRKIMTLSYDSTVVFSNSVAHIEDRTLKLLNRVGAQGGENIDRWPMVFIGWDGISHVECPKDLPSHEMSHRKPIPSHIFPATPRLERNKISTCELRCHAQVVR